MKKGWDYTHVSTMIGLSPKEYHVTRTFTQKFKQAKKIEKIYNNMEILRQVLNMSIDGTERAGAGIIKTRIKCTRARTHRASVISVCDLR